MSATGLQAANEDPTYLGAEAKLEKLLAGKTAPTTYGNTVSLAGDVHIQGIVRNSSFVERVLSGPNGDSCERFDLVITPTTDLRAVEQGKMREAVNAMLREAFDTVTLPDGRKLSEAGFDFSGKAGANDELFKPYKEQVAEARKLVEAGIAEAGAKIPPEAANILLKAHPLDTSPATDERYYGPETSVEHGHVEMTLAITSKGQEGAKTNSAMVMDNINDRKEELLAAMRESAAASFASTAPKPEDMEKFKADLAQLDLKTELTDTGLKLYIGNKTDTPDKPNEPPAVGKTMLAELNGKNLEAIVNDTLLFKGKDADKVAHLIAQDEDVRRLVTQYKDASPKFAEALQNEALMDGMSMEAYNKAQENKKASQPIRPDINIDTSFKDGIQHNEIHVAMELPKGVMHKDVIAALAGKSLVKEPVGEMTTKLNEGRTAANEPAPQPVVGPHTAAIAQASAAANESHARGAA